MINVGGTDMPDSTQTRNRVDVIHQSRFYCALERQTSAVLALAKRTAAASAGSGRHPVARRLVAGDPGQKAGGHALAGPSCALQPITVDRSRSAATVSVSRSDGVPSGCFSRATQAAKVG